MGNCGMIANGGKSNCGNVFEMSTAGVLKREENRNQHWYASLQFRKRLYRSYSYCVSADPGSLGWTTGSGLNRPKWLPLSPALTVGDATLA